MSRLEVDSITFIVKGYIVNNGLPYFQKAVPPALRSRLGRSNIKVRLKEQNGHYALQCHRLNEQYSALFKAMRDDTSIVPSETKLAAVALLAQAGLRQGDGVEDEPIYLTGGRVESFNASDILHDFLAEKDHSRSRITDAAFEALKNKLPVLLSEIFPIYLDNHRKGKDKKFIASQQQHWNKLMNFLGDKPIKGVTREDARRYRDHRLASEVTPTTVAREINVIKAVFAKAIRELSLSIRNEFSGIEIPNSNKNVNDRLPYTPDQIKSLVREALKVDDEQRRIVIVLALTGARLAEIVGLRVKDFDVANKSIHIRQHQSRSLKTSHSERQIPVHPLAFNALKAQAAASKGNYLFPSYTTNTECKADSASATLNKWAKKFAPNRSMHCFRHALRDLLRSVDCPESVAKEIGGWSNTHDISVQYGKGYPIETKRKWLNKAFSFLR